MTDFKPGDKVDFLDEIGGGVVVAVHEKEVVVRDEDGFEYSYVPDKLVTRKWRGEGVSDPRPKDTHSHAQRTDDARGYRMAGGKKPFMEVDLHSHMLIESERGLSNGEILEIQLDHFRRSMDVARGKRIRKIVFIHGVGRGVLREELRKHLRDFPMVEYGNADFRIYGGGATEVRLYVNSPTGEEQDPDGP